MDAQQAAVFKSNVDHLGNGINFAAAAATTIPPAPEVNIAGIWASTAVLTIFVFAIVAYGLYRNFMGKTAEPVKRLEPVLDKPAERDATTNTIVTVSGNVPETYEQEVELEEK